MSKSARFHRGGRTRCHVTCSLRHLFWSITTTDSSRRFWRFAIRSEISAFISASFSSSGLTTWCSCSVSFNETSCSFSTLPIPLKARPGRFFVVLSNASSRLRAASLAPADRAFSVCNDSRVCVVSPIDTSHRRTTATSALEWLIFFRSKRSRVFTRSTSATRRRSILWKSNGDLRFAPAGAFCRYAPFAVGGFFVYAPYPIVSSPSVVSTSFNLSKNLVSPPPPLSVFASAASASSIAACVSSPAAVMESIRMPRIRDNTAVEITSHAIM
mmetsp:Transcript_6366/g.21320  ORF Transcript_6366/g.21320 Transcript_6366/m.21320 type:complete len:271 (-) Transcript_6366:2599-3411(-)